MGIVFSCCNRDRSAESDSLLQGSQSGYNTNADNDYDAAQRQLEQEEQKVLAREQELTEIVNNTNDKLIDISMMSNSGIVVQGHDLDDVLNTEDREQDNSSAATRHEENKFTTLDPSKIGTSDRKAVQKLYTMLFDGLFAQLHVETAQKLIVTL